MSPAAAYAVNAARDPGRLAVIDDRESVTYADVDRRSSIVAATLGELGVGAGDPVALLARNSAAFVVAQVAISKLGADVLYLNTGFAGPQLGEVLAREGAVALVADDEFAAVLDEVASTVPRLTAWVADGSSPTYSIDGLVDAARGLPAPALPPPAREGRHVILTSGTTGSPRGAAHARPASAAAAIAGVALLDAIPYRGRGTTVLAAPAFHAWGLGNLAIGMLLQSTLVMSRTFDAAAVLALIERHRADTLVAVPVMCERLLEVPDNTDVSSLQVVAVSGSALPATLAPQFMRRFGDVLFSLYGSTEVAFVSVARPEDLRRAPTTAGRVLRGVAVRVVDDDGHDVAHGGVGRVFVRSGMSFGGYTSGEDKDRLDGLVSTGDVGRFGDDGLLFLEGRDDEMIVSGGENVFPVEVEGVLRSHPAVADVAVVGTADERFGQALVAHVVTRPGVSTTADELRDHVKSQLATYKAPREVVFHEALPRNETGKVVKRALGADRPQG
jgi:acyl-CoA synthetase (AMP-forming)/AMP-acid ligase II